MTTLLLMATLALSADRAAYTLPDGLTKDEKSFIQMIYEVRQGEIELLGLELKELKAEAKRRKSSGRSYIGQSKQAARVQGRMRQLRRDGKSGKPYVPILSEINSKTFGYFFETLSVNQVIGDGEMLVERPDETTIWLSGISTDNVVDGDVVGIENVVMQVTGTKTYTTAIGGTKTVYHLEAYDIEWYLALNLKPKRKRR